MSQVCDICGRKPTTGKQVSHSHRKTNRRFLPNVTVKRIKNPTTGITAKTKICMKCLKTLTKKYIQKTIPEQKKPVVNKVVKKPTKKTKKTEKIEAKK